MGYGKDDIRLYSGSALIAGLLCNLLTNPLWMVRTRMQVEIFRNDTKGHFEQKYSHGMRSLYINMKDIADKEGFLSLYRGLPASCIGLLHPLVFFPIYEKQKIYYKKHFEPDADKLSTTFILASSVTSKFIASAVSYPHEVLRARKYYEIHDKNGNKENLGLVKLSRKIVQTEGPTALYSGFLANLSRVLPNTFLMFALYEHLCHLSGLNQD